jgi:hypothetical protein
MKSLLFLFAGTIIISCGKQAVKNDGGTAASQTISAKVNNKIWVSKINAKDASTAAAEYAYFANLSSDGKTLTIIAYGTSGVSNNRGADKLGIVIYPFAGIGKYAITSAGTSKAVFASVNGDAVPVDIYNSNDDMNNLINITVVDGNKVSGTFSFNAQTANGMVKITDGTFNEVPAMQ